MRLFISGPMSGIQDFNYPVFNAAAAMLRDKSYVVHNPAENPSPSCGSWEGYMRLSIRQLTHCDAIVVLPGWESSRGASEEVRVAGVVGMTVYPLSHF